MSRYELAGYAGCIAITAIATAATFYVLGATRAQLLGPTLASVATTTAFFGSIER